MKESEISREKARAIMEEYGLVDEWDPNGDYSVIIEDDGEEYLYQYGYDTPWCCNRGTVSWL